MATPAPKRPKDVDVDVHIIRDANAKPDGLDYYLDSSELGKGHELTFVNQKGHDGFRVKFHIVDDTGDGWLFMDKTLDPMWVKPVADRGETCPDDQHKEHPVFKTVSVEDNNRTLVALNTNPKQELFKFALMFSRTPHQGPYERMYDPIINNQNGSTDPPGVFGTGIMSIAGGAVLLGAAVYALFRFGVFSR